MMKINRKLHKIDAEDQVLGRLASRIAILLIGKNKKEYLPRIDGGDLVEVSNVDKMKFTGKKMGQKVYRHHSGYIGGLKEEKLSILYKKNPAKILWRAVYGMLPKNKLRIPRIKRLKIVN